MYKEGAADVARVLRVLHGPLRALLLQRIPVLSGGLEGDIAADSDSERFSLNACE